MYVWGKRLIVLITLLSTALPCARAQTRTADIGATIFTDASPTALVRSRSLPTLFAEGYTYEAVLTQDVRIPHMLVYNPQTKTEQWVSKTAVGQPLVLSIGTHVLLKQTGETVNYSDFIVFTVPGQNEQLIPGCGNKCRGVSIEDWIRLTTGTAPHTPPASLPPPVSEQPERPMLKQPEEHPSVRCENSIQLAAHPDRIRSIRMGIWKNLGNGLFAGAISAASGGWQTGLVGLGLTVGGGAVADAWHPQHYRIRLGLDGQWQEFPAEPTLQPWNDLQLRLQVRATDLGGKVAEVLVEGHPECSAYLPLPNNRNYVYVFALRGKQRQQARSLTEPGPRSNQPILEHNPTNTQNTATNATATNNNQNTNTNNISVTIQNSRPRRAEPEKPNTAPPIKDHSSGGSKTGSSHDHAWSDKNQGGRKK